MHAMNSSTSNFTTNHTSKAVPLWIQYHVELSVWYALMVTLCVVGTVSSTAVLISILPSRKLRSGSGALIANLLVSIAVQCAVFLPLFTASVEGVPLSIPASSRFCRGSFFLYFLLNKVISIADMMIGINRFVAICFPFKYPAFTTHRVLAIMILIPWMLSFAYSVFLLLGVSGRFEPLPPWNACGTTFINSASSFLSVLVGVIIPIGTLAILFAVIFVVILVRWLSNDSGKETPQMQALRRRRYQSIRMLFVAYVLYSACFMPTQIASSVFSEQFRTEPLLQLLFRTIALLGYAVVPMIYLGMNEQYQKPWCRIWRRIRRRWKARISDSTMRPTSAHLETVHAGRSLGTLE